MATPHQIANLQRDLNRFTSTWLKGVAPLHIDGVLGPLTLRHLRMTQWWLGYQRNELSQHWNQNLLEQMRSPHSLRYTNPARMARGMVRRGQERAAWYRTQARARVTSGVTTFDGRPVAAWLVPYLQYARAHGWGGRLVSGFRDPVYSEHLCYGICGRPFCPGRCAGRASNHSGSVKPRGAVDVSEYWRFGQIVRYCPLSPHIFNALPADPVHYSASGR